MKTWNAIEEQFDTTVSDADLNRNFAREFWDYPIDERNNTYWHDDDNTPQEDNHEWKPLPDFVNDWSAVRKLLAASKIVVPVFRERGLKRKEKTRRTMIAMLVLPKEAAKGQP